MLLSYGAAAAGRGDRRDAGRRGGLRKLAKEIAAEGVSPSTTRSASGEQDVVRRTRAERADRGRGVQTGGDRADHGRRRTRRHPDRPQPDSGPHDRTSRTAGTPSPDLKIIETRVYRGPNVWSYDPAIHLVVDLGSLEDFPIEHDPRLHRAAARVPAPARPAPLLARPQGRLHRAAARGHLARATSPSTSRCSSSRRPATTCGAARPARSRACRAATTSSTRTPTRRSAWPPGELAVRFVNHLVAARRRTSTSPPSSEQFI